MFIYYWPNPFDLDAVKSVLEYAFDRGTSACRREVSHGPSDQGPGTLLCDEGADKNRLRIDLENQYWRRIPNSPAWVGMYRCDKLSPSALQRRDLVDGLPVELADGTRWQVAFARRFAEIDGGDITAYCPLPRTLELDDAGKWRPTKVAPRFRRLAELAERFWRASVDASLNADDGSETVRFNFDAIDDLAIGGIQANYRIGSAELAFFDAYDFEVRQRLVAAIMDDATLRAWSQKKTGAATDGLTS